MRKLWPRKVGKRPGLSCEYSLLWNAKCVPLYFLFVRLAKHGPDRYRLNGNLSGNTAKSNIVRSGTSSISLILKGQGLGQPWIMASWSLLENTRRSGATDHKGSMGTSGGKVKGLILLNFKITVLINLSYLQKACSYLKGQKQYNIHNIEKKSPRNPIGITVLVSLQTPNTHFMYANTCVYTHRMRRQEQIISEI